MELPAKTKARIQGLDVMRFFAALIVLIYHYFFIGPLQGFYSMDVFFEPGFWGDYGVDIFFMLSGYVILMSAEGRKCGEFISARILRIYPAFIVCSIFTLLCGFIMSDTSIKDLTFRWAWSFTFMSDFFNINPLSSIYWTLMVEVKFYIMVAIIIKLNIWDKHKYKLIAAGLIISIVNTFYLNNNLIRIIFNTQYFGHFCIGILLYLFNKNERNRFMLPAFVASLMLVFRSMTGFYQWVKSLYDISYTEFDVLLFALLMITIMYFVSNYRKVFESDKLVSILGATSYTLYLIHADFGFFLRVQYFNKFLVVFPAAVNYINEYILMGIIAIIAIAFSIFIAVAIEPRIRKFVQKCIPFITYGKVVFLNKYKILNEIILYKISKNKIVYNLFLDCSKGILILQNL